MKKLCLTIVIITLLGCTAGNSISEKQAISLVKNRVEVQEWLALFSGPDSTSLATGGKPIIVVDNVNEGAYVIHVYESIQTHNATFGWYAVDVKTGALKNLMNENL